MVVGFIRESQIGEVVREHHASLAHDHRGEGPPRPWPWIITYYAVPLVATIWLASLGLAASRSVAIGMLAGVGVLGGLLFQVLAWIAGRLGAIADSTDVLAPSKAEVDLIERLDIARRNIAYASLVSLVLVAQLAVVALLAKPPDWMAWASTVLMVHFFLTLVLMLVRINAIGRTDRISALTKHARRSS
jgi:hypothetical protein